MRISSKPDHYRFAANVMCSTDFTRATNEVWSTGLVRYSSADNANVKSSISDLANKESVAG